MPATSQVGKRCGLRISAPATGAPGAKQAGFRACETAALTYGGFGYTKEYPRGASHARVHAAAHHARQIQLIMCHITEKVRGAAKTY